jgi:hypothetical protein
MTKEKVIKSISYALGGFILLWAGYHVFFTSVEHENAIKELPTWLQFLPDWILDMIIDIKKLF